MNQHSLEEGLMMVVVDDSQVEPYEESMHKQNGQPIHWIKTGEEKVNKEAQSDIGDGFGCQSNRPRRQYSQYWVPR